MPYRVLTGLSYPPDKRAEAGEIVDDIPSQSVKWLLTAGHIEDVGAASSAGKSTAKPVSEPKDGDK